MQQNQATSRKYRPQKFSDVIGQQPIVATLQNAIRLQKVAHAYLFCGSRGTGKTTLARVFAKALNCESPVACEPCGTCASCAAITSGRFLDVIEIDGASHRGIDDIRQINETVGYATSNGKYKIFIIDEVHMLTKEAFNALLKTLEEPPANVKFFFATTEPHKLPATIISRCQRFDLKRISSKAILQKLSTIASDLTVTVEDGALEILSRYAEGSMRDAESLLDQILCYSDSSLSKGLILSVLGVTSREIFFQLDQAIDAGNIAFAFTLAETVFDSGKELSYFLDELIEHYRILLLHKLQSPVLETIFLTVQDAASYKKTAEYYNEEQCLYYLDFLLHKQQELSHALCKRVMLEMIFLHLIKNKRRVSIDQLVKKLITIESSLSKKEPLMKELPPQETPAKAPPKEATLVVEPVTLVAPAPAHVVIAQAPVAMAPVPAAPPVKEEAIALPVENNIAEQNKYDTIMRFAAVELEGTISLQKGV